jgi:hypothetical protein
MRAWLCGIEGKFAILTLKYRNKMGKSQEKNDFFLTFLRIFCDFKGYQHEMHGFAARMEKEASIVDSF